MRSFRHFLCTVAVVSLFASKYSEAGTIMLSGDGNIGNSIDGTFTAVVNPDNSLFFRNVLGSGTKVYSYIENPVPSIQASTTAIHNLYSGLSGVMSTYDISGSPITSSLFSGIDLFVVHPFDNFTPSEIAAMSSFVNGPGTLFFIGENSDFTNIVTAVNTALTALGSSMQLGNTILDLGVQQSTNLAVDPYTTGMTSFSYIAQNSISGGTPLVRSQSASGSVPFIAYQRFQTPPSTTVPEPFSSLIWGIGIAFGALQIRRRRV